MNLLRCTFLNSVRELNSALSAQVGFNCKSLQVVGYFVHIEQEAKATCAVPLSNVISVEILTQSEASGGENEEVKQERQAQKHLPIRKKG
jgi:hypothetical protein